MSRTVARLGKARRPPTVGPPLERAYSHRDCELEPPLLRSLEHGFVHVEADVFCLAGRLFVAHDVGRLRPHASLKRLYLDPLRALVASRGGKVFEDGTPLWLHLDVKTSAEPALRAVLRLLARYPDLFAGSPATVGAANPVRVVLSGNRPAPAKVAALRTRSLALDGRTPNLGVVTDAGVMPVISDDWGRLFSWRGEGPMPEPESRQLASMVRTAHGHAQKLRFWGTPDAPGPARECLWEHLLQAGVDLLNSDDVAGLRRFLETRSGGSEE